MQEQIDAQRVEFGQEANKILETPAQSVNRSCHDHVELALCGIATPQASLASPQ
jgi:hypothetical protein